MPASVYKQAHSCWHWYCTREDERRKPRLTRGLRYHPIDYRPFLLEVLMTPRARLAYSFSVVCRILSSVDELRKNTGVTAVVLFINTNQYLMFRSYISSRIYLTKAKNNYSGLNANKVLKLPDKNATNIYCILFTQQTLFFNPKKAFYYLL